MYRRLIAKCALLLALPLVALGGTVDATLEPMLGSAVQRTSILTEYDEASAMSRECTAEGVGDSSGQEAGQDAGVDNSAVRCCWIRMYGIWYCIVC